MVEAYCRTCDAVTWQSVVNVLFGALPTGHCLGCQHTNPLTEKLPLVLNTLLGKDLQEYQDKRAQFEERQES